MSSAEAENTEFKPVPAPWTVKAEAWWFITALGHKPDPIGETLSGGHFSPRETQLNRVSTTYDAFRGGRGSITLLRYTDTPIGSFDELAVSPGEFINPFEPKPSHRVTRAYVSSLPAVVNGRGNWGLPRELAQFVFSPSLDHTDATEIHVYPATSYAPVTFSDERVFSAVIIPVWWLPAIPASLSPFPKVKLFQPPLEASEDAAYNGLVGTSKWHVVDCSAYKGRAKPFRCEGLWKLPEPDFSTDPQPAKRLVHKSGFGDGMGFPKVEPYSIGIHWKEVEITLPQAVPLATL